MDLPFNVGWFGLIVAAAPVVLAASLFLVLYNSIISVVEVVVRFWKRLFVSWAAKRVRDFGLVKEEPWKVKQTLDLPRMLILAGTPLVALLVWDWLLSPIVLGLGLLLLWWLNYASHTQQRDQINEDAEMVALQIRSQLKNEKSLLSALRGIDLPEGRMRMAINEVASRLEMHQTPEQAAQALKGLPGTATARLAALIANNARITEETQLGLLLSLEQEAQRQKLIRDKVRQSMALIRGTVRLLQGVVAASLIFVVLVPDWRNFFLQDAGHRSMLTALVFGSVMASLYFEYEVYQLSRGEGF